MSGYSPYSQNSYSPQYGPSNYSSYSNSYPRYSSGYNHNGYNNSSSPYSNTYSKPMPQNPENPQVPPPNLRQDVWGMLNGFHALLNVLYAGTGIVHFGKIFVRMTLKVIKAICGKSASAVFKLTGLSFLKKIMLRSFSQQGDWSKDFNAADSLLESAWGNNEGSTKSVNQGLFGKIMLVLRVCSLIGTGIALYMRTRVNQQYPRVNMQDVEPEVLHAGVEEKQIEFESVKNLYDDIKLIEEERESAIELGDNNDVEEIIKVESEDVQEEQIVAEIALDKEEIQVVSEDMGNNTLKLLESQLVNSQNSLEEEREKETDKVLSKEILDTMITSPTFESNQVAQTQPLMSQESAFQHNILPQEAQRERLISEDFWKNTETSKQIESLNNKDEEKKNQVYEAPSMLQALKDKPAANKPWLMKKKRVEA